MPFLDELECSGGAVKATVAIAEGTRVWWPERGSSARGWETDTVNTHALINQAEG